MIKNHRLLTREAEIALAKRVQENNDENAAHELVTSNLRLVVKIAKDFRKTIQGREADIFDNRILAEKPETLREIGKRYDISREMVRQIQIKIIKRIENRLRKEMPEFEDEFAGTI